MNQDERDRTCRPGPIECKHEKNYKAFLAGKLYADTGGFFAGIVIKVTHTNANGAVTHERLHDNNTFYPDPPRRPFVRAL